MSTLITAGRYAVGIGLSAYATWSFFDGLEKCSEGEYAEGISQCAVAFPMNSLAHQVAGSEDA